MNNQALQKINCTAHSVHEKKVWVKKSWCTISTYKKKDTTFVVSFTAK